MAKFKGAEMVKKIDKMLDKGLAKFLFNTQSKLSAASPVDTGRLAQVLVHAPALALYALTFESNSLSALIVIS